MFIFGIMIGFSIPFAGVGMLIILIYYENLNYELAISYIYGLVIGSLFWFIYIISTIDNIYKKVITVEEKLKEIENRVKEIKESVNENR